MPIKLKNINIIEKNIVGYVITPTTGKAGFERVHIVIYTTAVMKVHFFMNIFYNVADGINYLDGFKPEEVNSQLDFWLTTEKVVNKIIKQLKNLK